MNVYEMEGFLRGQCVPRDLLVNESIAAYLVRKLSEIASVKAERDALAVENAALKNAITTHSQSTHFCELCGKDDPCSTDDVCYALNETPATDAALAAIRKESHIAGIQAAADRIGVISLKYKPGQKQELIKAIGREVFQYANELREAK